MSLENFFTHPGEGGKKEDAHRKWGKPMLMLAIHVLIMALTQWQAVHEAGKAKAAGAAREGEDFFFLNTFCEYTI